MEALPLLVVEKIAEYLCEDDIARLSRTCSFLRVMLPRYLVIRGKDFHINGPGRGHWAPENYFDSPPLSSSVKLFKVSLTWNDQGWGNRKGEIFVKLIRKVNRNEEEIAEKRHLFGIAGHKKASAEVVVSNDPIVDLAQPGDYYKFMRNAGGGGGHTLTVENFRVVITLPNNQE